MRKDGYWQLDLDHFLSIRLFIAERLLRLFRFFDISADKIIKDLVAMIHFGPARTRASLSEGSSSFSSGIMNDPRERPLPRLFILVPERASQLL